ncbi:hypothetical protein N7523_007371 [Penicillium sp. IBT 18751x]|nr:hypothetical protein N7523_007371 [Penicillium sp. IBT 18751x]
MSGLLGDALAFARYPNMASHITRAVASGAPASSAGSPHISVMVWASGRANNGPIRCGPTMGWPRRFRRLDWRGLLPPLGEYRFYLIDGLRDLAGLGRWCFGLYAAPGLRI